MDAQTEKGIKTVCGAIFFQMFRYNDTGITKHDWENLCHFLKADKLSIFCVQEIHKHGFTVSTQNKTLWYRHSDFMGERKIELIEQ